ARRHGQHRRAILQRCSRVQHPHRLAHVPGVLRIHRGRRDAGPSAQGQVGGEIPDPEGNRDPGDARVGMGADPDRRGARGVFDAPAEVRPAGRVRERGANRDMTVARAAELLSAARSGLALTGAGVSAESGIPTFRGEGGVWTRYDPVKVASIDAFLEDPTAYWRVSKE